MFKWYSYFPGNTYGAPWPDTGIVLLVYMQMIFIRYRKHTRGFPRPDKGIALLFYFLFSREFLLKILQKKNLYDIHPSTYITMLMEVMVMRGCDM
jgi:hypothetical protein